MKYKDPRTLAYFQDAPQMKLMPVGHLPVAALAEAGRIYKDAQGSLPVPDAEAIRFYALNHVASIVRSRFTPNETLPDWAHEVMVGYSGVLTQQSKRLLHYMMMIITREGRHLKNVYDDKIKKGLAEIDLSFPGFIEGICGVSEDKAVSRYLNLPPPVSAAKYASAFVFIFNNGKWGGGYGGKPWGVIASTLLDFFNGKTSLEMMVDTAYTLAHNNGPMFNKYMLYDHYTGKLLTILDIQRSGQIPELLLGKGTFGEDFGIDPSFYDGFVTGLVKKVKQACPSEIGDYVDWFKVEALGAVGTYTQYKAAQAAAHATKVATTYMGKPAEPLGKFEVTPGSYVQILSRKAA